MYITPLSFTEVLNRFYNQDKYDILLLFVSSFDGNDNIIIREIVGNANRIDRITGSKMCFYYFMDSTYDCFEMNEMVRWVKSIPDRSQLFANGADRTMRIADEICHYFGILRSRLPAFILIDKDRAKRPFIYSIRDYNDFEAFLTPINILHTFIEDKEFIINDYEIRKRRIISDYNEKRRRTVVTQYDVDNRKTARLHWEEEIKRLETRKEIELSRGEDERANKREINIAEFKCKLKDYPDLVVCGEDKSIPYPQEELDALCFPREQLFDIEKTAIEKLDLSLNSHEGSNIITGLQSYLDYSSAIYKIAELIKTKDVRISRIIEKIRYEIHENGFDVFISCKSQDYSQAHTLYGYLVNSGFKPFLADSSLKEIGIDQYTAVIGEVIDVCQNMIVFATDVSYLETTYVSAEWHMFVNDINTGHKPNARIVNVLSSDIDIHTLPSWLRDKQCFTTENYQKGLIHFLRNIDNSKLAQELIEQVQESSSYFRQILSQLDASDNELNHQIQALSVDIKKHANYFCDLLNEHINYISQKELKSLSTDIRRFIECVERDTYQIVCQHEKQQKQEELLWEEISHTHSRTAIKRYLWLYPNGHHIEEAIQYLKMHSMCCRAPRDLQLESDCIGHENHSSESTVPTYLEEEIQESFFPSSPDNYASEECDSTEKKSHNVRDGFLKKLKHIFEVRGNVADSDSSVSPIESYVNSSIFAPSEVRKGDYMMVQVFLYKNGEELLVASKASEVDSEAIRQNYTPLSLKLKSGDKVKVTLKMSGPGVEMEEPQQEIMWQGHYTDCQFGIFVSDNYKPSSIIGTIILFVNDIPCGRMLFKTKIVDKPKKLYARIESQSFKKIFISYSHLDESKVKYIAEAYRAQGVDYFFDRHYLKAGDVYPEKIKQYINSADLFILCWSKNAAESEYVGLECSQAMSHAYPQIDMDKATISIHPISIEPYAAYPKNMAEIYDFEKI